MRWLRHNAVTIVGALGVAYLLLPIAFGVEIGVVPEWAQ